MAKINRVVDNNFLQDPMQIEAVQNNPASGGKKVLPVGPKLNPIQISGGYTTNVTALTALPALGLNLAIYNNAGTAASVTIGGSTTTSLAIGATDANGNVGVALPPNSWTNLSMGNNQFIIASAATVIVYIVEDPTRLAQETGPYAQQFVNGTQLPINS